MKIRYIAGIFTAAMFVLMAAFYIIFTGEELYARDMVFYNKEMKTIEEELENGVSIGSIQQLRECEILFLEDRDYESRLNAHIGSGSVILDYYKDGAIFGKLVWRTEENQYMMLKKNLRRNAAGLCAGILLTGYLGLGMAYFYITRPFRQLKSFTKEIAKGNLDLPLPIHKHNMFGAFTESFDIMREELKSARKREYEANVSKKELIAELSHDIKTPLSTIKAACELMQVKELRKDTLEKAGIIYKKAEMIEHLISNMFHATLEELQMIKVEVTEESTQCIPQMFLGLKYYGEIRLENEVPECLVYMDSLRLQQVIDNIVNNSFKYAKTPVQVVFSEEEHGILMVIRDWGPGISQDETALVTEKFYRGSNARGKSGSGLGLFLARNFMERMGGSMECHCRDGFVTEVFLRKAAP